VESCLPRSRLAKQIDPFCPWADQKTISEISPVCANPFVQNSRPCGPVWITPIGFHPSLWADGARVAGAVTIVWAKSRPLAKVSTGGARAAIAVAEMGPMPGTVISLRDTSSSRGRRAISLSRSAIKQSNCELTVPWTGWYRKQWPPNS
jgi:hypothetical protein